MTRCFLTSEGFQKNDKIILMGDFNDREGRNHNIWHGVIGDLGVGKMNNSGLRLLSLCSEFGHAITNTFFQLRDMLRLLGCIPGQNTGTSLTTSLSGVVT